MVGPISDEERSNTVRRVKIGFVVLIGLSGGLISLQGDASLQVSLLAVGAGLVVGAFLVWIVFPGTGAVRSERGRRRPPGR